MAPFRFQFSIGDAVDQAMQTPLPHVLRFNSLLEMRRADPPADVPLGVIVSISLLEMLGFVEF